MDGNYNLSSPSWSMTSNKTFSRSKPFIGVYPEVGIPAAILDGGAILVGATANLLVIIVMVRNRSRLQNMDLFVLNLCFSGFLISVCAQPLVISRLLAKSRRMSIEDTIRRMTTYLCLISSCSSLFLVTLDRYLSIRFPLHYSLYVNKTRIIISIVCSWIIAGVIASGTPINLRMAGNFYLGYMITLVSLTMAIQILSFLIAKTQENRIHRLQQSLSHNHPNMETTNQSSRARRKYQVDRKASTTVMILFLVYVLSWLPMTLFRGYFSMAASNRKTFVSGVHSFNVLLQIHACINPFIYVLRTRHVRAKFLMYKS